MSINKLDYATIQGFTLLIGVLYMALNILVDLSYGLIDPRVRTS
jgi:peptide/nickel transport system permease protein